MPRASTFASPRLLIPLAALLATFPLLLHGNSCGQDLTFHLQSWIDAAQQLSHGHYPRWDATAAWNAGEPRFLFYPPISWLLGAALTLLLPVVLPSNTALDAAPIAFIFIALLASGLTFHRLARSFAAPRAALIASALYLANPYMLFNAFERSALAELLAAAWIPLLLLALFRPRPTVRGIAIPLALLWLTNVPAAVMGSYLLALLAAIRVLQTLRTRKPISVATHPQPSASRPETRVQPSASRPETCVQPSSSRPETCVQPSSSPPEACAQTLSSRPERAARSGETPVFPAANATANLSPLPPFRLALTYLAGTLLGLALPAFYLIPAATERPLIQAAMALIPPLRYQDNFLFTHTADAAHNAVNHTASLLALTLLLTAAALVTLLLTRRKLLVSAPPTLPVSFHSPTASPASLVVIPGGNLRPDRAPQPFAPILALLTLVIAFLLTPLSTPIWRYLPDLAFLQFPWRLLTLLTPILALAIALLLDRFSFAFPKSSSSQPHKIPSSRPERSAVERPLYSAGAPRAARLHRAKGAVAILVTLALPLTLGLAAHHLYSQPCDPADTPAILAHNLATHHGTLPTDEYTPSSADNDLLRTDDPGFWLAPLSNPNAPAPNTHPTATELDPSIDTDDTPVPLAQTLSTPAPHRLTVNLAHPAILVLNLRNYPNWRLTLTHATEQLSPSAQDSVQNSVQNLQRSDGLLAIALPSGPSTVSISWRDTPDQNLGLATSVLAVLALALTFAVRAGPRARPVPQDVKSR